MSKFVYDQAFDLYEELKSKPTTLTDYPAIIMSEPIIDSNTTYLTADYSTDIHHYLDKLHKKLIGIIKQPISLHNNEF